MGLPSSLEPNALVTTPFASNPITSSCPVVGFHPEIVEISDRDPIAA